jgi:hypothetical protein
MPGILNRIVSLSTEKSGRSRKTFCETGLWFDVSPLLRCTRESNYVSTNQKLWKLPKIPGSLWKKNLWPWPKLLNGTVGTSVTRPFHWRWNCDLDLDDRLFKKRNVNFIITFKCCKITSTKHLELWPSRYSF